MPRNTSQDRALEAGDEFQKSVGHYLNEDSDHYDPPPGRKLEILWDERKYRLRRRNERINQLKVYGLWAGWAAGIATALSTLIGMIPWPKVK